MEMKQSELDAMGVEVAKFIETNMGGGRYIIILASPGDSPLTSIVSKLEPSLVMRLLKGIAQCMESGDVASYAMAFNVDPPA